MRRHCPPENKTIHHVFNKSIYHFEIFTCESEYQRMLQLIRFYQYDGHAEPFSQFIKKIGKPDWDFSTALANVAKQKAKLVDIIAYCLMPTHVHLILQQLADKGIETYVGRVLNAYSNYFNLRHNRRGPLWQNRFGNRLILDETSLNQRIAYVLNNPVKDNLVETAVEWKFSSINLPTPGGWGG